jgi:porphyrinogen peroxidase
MNETTAAMSQPGILAPVPPLARYLVFSPTSEEGARAALAKLAKHVNGDSVLVGIGDSLVQLFDAHIEGLRHFPTFTGAGIEAPSSAGSLWCWLRGNDRGHLLHNAREIESILVDSFTLERSVDAFKYDSGRDLTGYEDGTENPVGDDAIAAALLSHRHSGLNGSSFVAVQQWLMNFKRFDSMSNDSQDNAIGRRKVDNEELDDAPLSAHVKRTAQESFTPEAFLLRRSMPWSEGDRCGLMFVAFGKSFDAFEAQLQRMMGEDDGIRDALFDFTHPITGNYFWCPPIKDHRLDLSAIGI